MQFTHLGLLNERMIAVAEEDSSVSHRERPVISSGKACSLWSHCIVISHNMPAFLFSCCALVFPPSILWEYLFPLVAPFLSFSHMMTNWKSAACIGTVKFGCVDTCHFTTLFLIIEHAFGKCAWCWGEGISNSIWHFPSQTFHHCGGYHRQIFQETNLPTRGMFFHFSTFF